MTATPTLETCAGLYAAAHDQLTAALRSVENIVASSARHGFSESELIEASEAYRAQYRSLGGLPLNSSLTKRK